MGASAEEPGAATPAATPDGGRVRGAVRRLATALPRGTELPEATWNARHRAIVWLLWAHVPLLFGFALFGGTDRLISGAHFIAYDVDHALLEVGIIVAFGLAASWKRWSRRVRSIAASAGLVTCSALLTHFSGGYIEAHFHFFVMVGVISMYQDWVPFLVGIGYVAVHHGVAGTLDPTSVFNHSAAFAHPWRWGAIHAFFILGLSTVELVHWRTAERERARTEMVLESAGEGILGVDTEGYVTFANRAAAHLTGTETSALVGRRTRELLVDPDTSGPDDLAPLTALGGASKRASGEAALAASDGRRIPVDWVSTPLVEANEVVGAVIALRDATERRQAAAALERHADELETTLSLLRGTLDATADGILVIGNDGRITSHNQRFLDLWQVPEALVAEGNAHALAVLLDKLDQPKEQALARIHEINEGEPPESFDTLRFKNGRVIERHSRPHEVGGRRVGRVWSFRDVTDKERSRAELQERAEELAKSNAELERFAYVASHDLQEPLRMVSSYVQLLERRYAHVIDDDGRTYVAYASEGAQRMHALLNGLLAYSRVGRQALVRDPVSLRDVLDEALANLQPLDDGVELAIEADTLPTVLGERVQLVQVLQNLLGNAVKFRAPDRPVRITVSAAADGPWCTVAVADNGIGIEPQYHERIFAIFQRLHSRALYPGTGVGLAICKKVIEHHGGRLWVESEPGAGATFRFTLPVGTESHEAKPDGALARTDQPGHSSRSPFTNTS